MKRLLLIVLPLLLIVGCSKEPINYETTLIERDEIFYTKDTNKPYSGQVFSLYDDGKKKGDGILKDGKMISKTEWEYYGNGEKKSEERAEAEAKAQAEAEAKAKAEAAQLQRELEEAKAEKARLEKEKESKEDENENKENEYIEEDE